MTTPSPQPAAPAPAGPAVLVERAYALSTVGNGSVATDAAQQLIHAAGPARRDLETARDQVAARVAARVDDFAATRALQLLNRALSQAPIHDPLDWRVRWTQRFRRP